MPLQVAIEGFKKKRAKLQIVYDVDRDVRRERGPQLRRSGTRRRAEAAERRRDLLPRQGASSTTDQIKIGDKIYDLVHGMPIKGEIAIETRPFLADVFPFFEKYFD